METELVITRLHPALESDCEHSRSVVRSCNSSRPRSMLQRRLPKRRLGGLPIFLNSTARVVAIQSRSPVVATVRETITQSVFASRTQSNAPPNLPSCSRWSPRNWWRSGDVDSGWGKEAPNVYITPASDCMSGGDAWMAWRADGAWVSHAGNWGWVNGFADSKPDRY